MDYLSIKLQVIIPKWDLQFYHHCQNSTSIIKIGTKKETTKCAWHGMRFREAPPPAAGRQVKSQNKWRDVSRQLQYKNISHNTTRMGTAMQWQLPNKFTGIWY